MDTLMVSGLASLSSGLLYLYVGAVLAKRRVSVESQLANNMFVLWWYALGATALATATNIYLYDSGRLAVPFYETIRQASVLSIMVALWGLLFYLVYLYTGKRHAFAPIGFAYFVGYIALVAFMASPGPPETLTDNGWAITPEPAVEFSHAAGLLIIALLVGPQIVAAIAYFRLYRRATTRTQKYRIGLVSGSIIVWFGSSIVASVLDATGNDGWQLFSKVLAILAAVAILFAYRPPAWVRTRYDIEGIES